MGLSALAALQYLDAAVRAFFVSVCALLPPPAVMTIWACPQMRDPTSPLSVAFPLFNPTVDLSATFAGAPLLVVAPSTVGIVASVGAAAVTTVLTVSNSGNSQLVVSSVTIVRGDEAVRADV